MGFKDNDRLTIGLLIDWLSSPWHLRILQGLTGYAEENNINLVIYVGGHLNAPNAYEPNRHVLFKFAENNIELDGLIILTVTIATFTKAEDIVAFCRKYNNCPVVSMGRMIPGIPSIYIDNRSGMEEMMHHLLGEHGYRRPAVMKGPQTNEDARVRFQVYQEMLERYGVAFDPELVVESTFNVIDGFNSIVELVENRQVEFDCFIALDDDSAMGAYEALKNYGLKIPDDVAVVGFDDIEEGQFSSPQLTTVQQATFSLARRAMELIHKQAIGQAVFDTTPITTSMVKRESCGCNFEYDDGDHLHYLMEEGNCNDGREAIAERLFKRLSWINIYLDEKQTQSYNRWLSRLINEFIKGVGSRKQTPFIECWKELSSANFARSFTETNLHDFLSLFRQEMTECVKGGRNLSTAEQMLHQARTMVSWIAKSIETAQRVFLSSISHSLRFFNSEIDLTIDIDEQLKILSKYLKQLNMKSCYIALYEDPNRPHERSRLIYYYKNGKQMDVSGLPSFPTSALVPEGYFVDDRRFTAIVESLYFGDELIGYIILDFITWELDIYNRIRSQISSSFKKSFFIKDIKNYTTKLENKVKERTKELVEINERLKSEIAERIAVEKKLQVALFTLEKVNDKLHNMSIKDDLTGLYNRRGFITLGAEQLKAAEEQGRSFLVFFIDLDGLKMINDTYGHEEGDHAIVQLAMILTRCFPKEDIMARLGGDEFTILSLSTEVGGGEQIIKRLEEAAAEVNSSSGKPYRLSLSTGYATYNPDQHKTIEELLAEADKKLYIEKKAKKSIALISTENADLSEGGEGDNSLGRRS